MLTTASLTLLALAISAVWALSGAGSPLAAAHLAFAAGILPLIFAAMLHFVPVLTRTGDPGRRLARLPIAAQAAGLLAVAGMQGLLPYGAVHLAAAVDLLLAAILLHWIAARARAALGAPHPGWRWYAAALVALMLALATVALGALLPAAWYPLRLVHLHLNTLGLVGLAAFGTLPVLMPTALGEPDPEAALWLRRRLAMMAGGALMAAVGSALFWPLSLAGGALLLLGAASLLVQWWRRFGSARLADDGIVGSLAVAVIGMALLMLAGIAHGVGVLPARPSIVAWAALFLLPLVSGALSQLLPVWRWPGPATPQRAMMRRQLAAGGRWRAWCFLLGGLAWLAAGEGAAGVTLASAALIGLGLAGFAIALLQAVRVTRSTR